MLLANFAGAVGAAEERGFMLTGFPRKGRAFSSVSRLACLLLGCLFAAASISWIRLSRSESSIDPPAATLAAVQATGQPVAAAQEPSQVSTDSLSIEQQRGKRIYATGTSPSGGKMTAVLGESPSEIPAVALKCVNCHLQDGRGKPEGGMAPSNIGWEELTKPYGLTDPAWSKTPSLR